MRACRCLHCDALVLADDDHECASVARPPMQADSRAAAAAGPADVTVADTDTTMYDQQTSSPPRHPDDDINPALQSPSLQALHTPMEEQCSPATPRVATRRALHVGFSPLRVPAQAFSGFAAPQTPVGARLQECWLLLVQRLF